ncbi:hypothetical protein Tco_1170039 [Tanacetum coccineum]
MAVRTQPTLSPSMSTRIAKSATMSPSSFHKRYRSSYETSPSSSLTILIWKRYREDKGHGSEDEDPGSEEEEEALPKGEGEMPSMFEPTLVTWVDPEDGRVYIDIPTYVPPVAPVQTPLSPKWTFVDEDEFLKVGAQLKLHESILHDHT